MHRLPVMEHRRILHAEVIVYATPIYYYEMCGQMKTLLDRLNPLYSYRPQFYFRTTDVTGVCNLPEGTEMCMPGDNIEMTIELIHPIAMSQGLTFAIREGGRTVGSGRVATIIE